MKWFVNNYGVLTVLVLLLLSITNSTQQQQQSKKAVKKKTGSANDVTGIRDVTSDQLTTQIDADDLLVLFYDAAAAAKDNRAVFKVLDKLDPAAALTFVKTSDGVREVLGDAPHLPSLVLFQNGLPETYGGGAADLTDLASVRAWLTEELESNDLDVMTVAAVERYAAKTKQQPLLVVFVEDSRQRPAHEDALVALCDRLDVNAVLVDDLKAARTRYGLDRFPSYVYFEDGVPTVYEEDESEDVEALMEWLEEQRTSDTLEEVTEEMLKLVLGLKEYVAVFFTGPCDENAPANAAMAHQQECQRVLRQLEEIDDELDDFGITLVRSHLLL